MEYRNAKVLANGWIDCELNHPDFGWIPFTADPNDAGTQFDVAELHQTMLNDPKTEPWDGKPMPRFVPQEITRSQCAMQLFTLGMISGEEAIAMTQTGVPPAAVQSYLNTLPATDKVKATIGFAAASYHRDNPVLLALMEANDLDSDQIDDFFIAASQN